MSDIHAARPARTRRLTPAARRRLEQPLPEGLVSERTTEDGEVIRYLEGWRAIEEANATFGPDRWGAELVGEITSRRQPGPDPGSAVVYTAVVRVTADGCLPHSDVGTAVAEDDSAEAHAVAVKSAATDALKRALRHFGARFGNGLGNEPAPAMAGAVGARPEELRRRVLEIARSAGSDEARTESWVERRYGRPLAELDAPQLLSAVEALSRGLHRRNGAQAA
ncbi:MAG: hypothetical protein F4150_01055 [Chloroflexi bacterium]|nr:hypothetical protein [Chloroflexota bacterium]